MAICKYCKNKKIFMKLTDLKVCESCHPLVQMNISNRIRIIQESVDIIAGSNNNQTIENRLTVIQENLGYLLKLLKSGIPFELNVEEIFDYLLVTQHKLYESEYWDDEQFAKNAIVNKALKKKFLSR
ncbi:MAG TPA: hypothetical protein VIG45_07230 [Erysipelothrix sp.]